jgi:hypothetical protein
LAFERGLDQQVVVDGEDLDRGLVLDAPFANSDREPEAAAYESGPA